MSNVEIDDLHQRNVIRIVPFDRRRLKLAHYRLRPRRLMRLETIDGEIHRRLVECHDFRVEGTYAFPANGYFVAECAESIILPDGIVGEYVPASGLVEQGFSLIAGKLDPHYGELDNQRQYVIFGLKNLLDDVNVFDASRGFAHIRFIDLRGARRFDDDDDYFSARERREFRDRNPRSWRAQDDGPTYPEPDEDEYRH